VNRARRKHGPVNRSHLVGVFFGCLLISACPPVPAPVQRVIDCAHLDAATLKAEMVKLGALIPDWRAVYTTAVADIEGAGVNVAGCALAEVTQAFLTRKAVPLDDGHGAHEALERFRAQHTGGSVFRTQDGDL